jgi:hypothetical protein
MHAYSPSKVRAMQVVVFLEDEDEAIVIAYRFSKGNPGGRSQPLTYINENTC